MKRAPSDRVRMLRCAITGVEATAATTAHTFARHSHDHFGVGIITHGGHRSASGRGPVEARTNDVITVNPGEVHDGRPFDERGRAWQMLYFEPALVFDAAAELAGADACNLELTRPVVYDPRLKKLFERLFAIATNAVHYPDALVRDEALTAFFECVIQTHATLAPRRFALGSITRAKARIDDDPSAPHTLAALAADSGMNRFQLLRAFARDVGMAPHAYLVQRRVMLARRSIASGLALADAAVNAGFADQSHMTRAFVRMFGVTPAVYADAVR
ncbi:AraC family transcriptional regulator [Paraburkholderia kururiensis]|uniref:AraC family transcriptional regulator n=1 Tax=Paraburkholderia kururiensis TaxID=984307 RepID=A0ABZ0WM77_9BURK|nr:AraC family transcriptional regulator [Paraburkholderia kururiensis]WQD78477.1 AraC family transcriptional regulator [Paraburkholderia kururiensis]